VHTLGRALDELIGVLAAGFVGFFVMLAYIAGGLIWFACGVTCFCFLLVALFSMVIWLFTRDTHAFEVMLGYFVHAGAAYAGVAAIPYCWGRLTDVRRNAATRNDDGKYRSASPARLFITDFR